jgi:hypothetical protein
MAVAAVLSTGLAGAAVGPTATSPARASVTQEQQKDVAVTIYNGNLGLVKDIRELVLGPGVHEVKFMDV